MTLPPKQQGNRPRVLVVDDNPDMLETTAAVLSREFEVLTARSGEMALQVLTRNSVNVVCTDFEMPGGINGIELLREVAVRHPGISAVLVTGYSQLAQQQKRADDVFLLVVKPYEPRMLVDVVTRAVRYSQMKRAFQELVPDKASL